MADTTRAGAIAMGIDYLSPRLAVVRQPTSRRTMRSASRSNVYIYPDGFRLDLSVN